MSIVLLYCLGNSKNEKKSACVSTDTNFFQMFSIHGWLNLWVWNPQIWRAHFFLHSVVLFELKTNQVRAHSWFLKQAQVMEFVYLQGTQAKGTNGLRKGLQKPVRWDHE
jgi:hypothetical protein